MSKIAKKDVPQFVRKCWSAWQKANRKNREAEIQRLKFYVGGDLQWRDEEITKRRNQKRPWVTVNKVKPAVDQIEGDIRLNPPGPKCSPVGPGADGDTADVIAGLIREVEYRSDAKAAYSTAGKYSAAGGFAALELATEYVSEHSFQQRLVIRGIEDPNSLFFDPNARMPNRQDGMWSGRLRVLSREDYVSQFGERRRVLESRSVQSMMGWIQEAIGIQADMSEMNEWTGGQKGLGPFYVAEFALVELEEEELTSYVDGITRFKDEPTGGAKPQIDEDGKPLTRKVARRKITKYVVDALEVLDETEWLGNLGPWIPVLGPEIYIDGQLHRLSLIEGAMDSQRALNYVATTMTELAGALPKSPWIGPMGTFDDPRWKTANSEMWAYLEYKPVFATDETTGQQTLAPPPARNNWEAPIQWLVVLANFFSDAIKACTGIYDPSLGQTKADQSGRAIEQLRSESSVGNFSYPDNLHRAIGVMYREMCVIFPKVLDGPRVVTIVRPDTQHELVKIGQDFQAANGKTKRHDIHLGEYSVRVEAGKDFATRLGEAQEALTNFFKAAPQALAVPGVAAQYMRIVADGNPEIMHMADLLDPQAQEGASPQEMQAKLAQASQQNAALTVLVNKMQMELKAKLPELQLRRWEKAIDSLTKIRVAEVTASKDTDRANADRAASLFESIMGMAHESAIQAVDHEHEASQAQIAAQQAEQQPEAVQ